MIIKIIKLDPLGIMNKIRLYDNPLVSFLDIPCNSKICKIHGGAIGPISVSPDTKNTSSGDCECLYKILWKSVWC